MKCKICFTLLLATSFLASAAVVAAVPGSSSPILNVYRENLRDDLDKAKQAQEQYDKYRNLVGDYIRQVEQICAEAHLQRGDIETQLSARQKQMPSLNGDEKAQAAQDIANLKNWLAAEANLSAQAARNIDLCQRWLAHFKDQSNIDSYNASRAEQAMQDEQRKLQNAQELIASEQRKARDRQYWQQAGSSYSIPYNGSVYGLAGNSYVRRPAAIARSASFAHGGGGHGGGHGR